MFSRVFQLFIIVLVSSPRIKAQDIGISARAKSFVIYDDIRHEKNFAGSGIRTHAAVSKNDCALACNRHGKCLSYNFCGRNFCFLNFDDIYSIKLGEELLNNQSDCRYFGMRRTVTPYCGERGFPVNITNDNHNGHCSISRKRVDRQWGEWETKTDEGRVLAPLISDLAN